MVEEEKVDMAFEGQIKRLYAVLHSLGFDPKQWKKDHNISSYAKLSREECSELIDELEQEEAEKKGNHEKAVEQSKVDIRTGTQKQIAQDILLEDAHAQAEMGRLAVVMTLAAREAKAIVDDLANGGGITEGTKASLTERFAVTMFIEGMRRGL